MTEEKILTKHPLGKSGKNIDKQKYDKLKGVILSVLKNKELTHTELFNQLHKRLKDRFSGNISWYGETVKLDLEARKTIERTSSKPQKYRLKSIDITTMKTSDRTNYGVTQIAQLFPSLKRIKDKSLREKVGAVWNEAITTGCGGKGWTFDELRAVKFTLLAGDIDMTFVEHLNSCARQCIAIADVLEKSFRCGIPVQRDYLIAGALLADVGKPLEYDKDASGKVVQGKFGQQVRHPFSGVALAYKHGIPGEVMHIIATHSHEGDKVERSIESIIFHHSDFVDFDIAKLLGKRAAKK
jgi:putative nucleotidyltransferase with HDIG domain